MKIFGIVMKIAIALAAVAGLVYVAATYGDKIVAWCKDIVARVSRCCEDDCVVEFYEEETPTEEVVATDADFEG